MSITVIRLLDLNLTMGFSTLFRLNLCRCRHFRQPFHDCMHCANLGDSDIDKPSRFPLFHAMLS